MKASNLYQELSQTYGSPYPDKPEEKRTAISILKRSIEEDPDMVTVILEKLKQVMRQQNMKVKLYALIEDKFWLKNFVQPITIRRFDHNQI